MARLAISLLAVLLVSSYASATNLDEVCVSTVDAEYCKELLKYTVSGNTDFKSVAWHRLVIDRATVVAMNASSVIAKLPQVSESNKALLKSCSEKFESSIKLLREAASQYGTAKDVPGKVDRAAGNHETCYDSLDDTDEELTPVRDAVNKAYNACLIAKDITSNEQL